MKNKFLLGLVIFLVGCSMSKDRLHFDEVLLGKIVEEGTEWPSKYSFFVYVKCENWGFSEIPTYDLQILYRKIGSGRSYESFLRESLNHKYSFSDSLNLSCFELDPVISEQYHNRSFKEFIDIYFVESNGKYTLKPEDVDIDLLKTVFYFCFINNYFVSHDDYIGQYYLEPASYY